MKKLFDFNFDYFDRKGRYCHSGRAMWKVRTGNLGEPNISDVLAKLRGLRDNGGQCGMPGEVDEGWDGYVLVSSEEGDPCLLLPPS